MERKIEEYINHIQNEQDEYDLYLISEHDDNDKYQMWINLRNYKKIREEIDIYQIIDFVD